MKIGSTIGKTIARGEGGFDEAVLDTSFNAYDPGQRPDFVCQANDIDDVIGAVRLACEKGLKLSVCSGGHSWSQNHIRDNGVMIDLSRLNKIEIDAAAKTAIIGPACRSGDLDVAVAKHGLFFPVGHAYTIGLGGFLLQGGFGWNSRVVGMGCENVTAIDVVLADGRMVHASDTENSDLFWAARGSGAGFFAIVVRFYLRLHDRPKFIGAKMQVFRLRYLEEIMAWADRVGQQVSPKVEFTVVVNRKAFGIFSHGIEVVLPVFADSRREAKQLVSFLDESPLRRKASLTLPLLKLSLKNMMKAAGKSIFPENVRWFVDNVWVKSPIDPVLPVIRRIINKQPESPSHFAWLNWLPRSDRPEMAFSLEGTGYVGLYGGVRQGRSTPADEHWAVDAATELQKHGIGSQLGDENLARRPTVFMAPEKLERVHELRKKYDPDGRFRDYAHLI